MQTYDQIVIGHGLAGAAVAWHLRWKGCRVLVVDGESRGSASQAAAGLITPVTGRQFAKTWRFDDCYPVAAHFYHHVEAETGAHFFAPRNAIRLFTDDHERDRFRDRCDPAFDALVRPPDPQVNDTWFAAPEGGFEMAPAARLDVARYLDTSRAHATAGGCFLTTNVDPLRDLVLAPNGVTLPRLGIRAGCAIFCQGLAARDNSWFRDVRFAPAKGEVLTVRVPGLEENRVVHSGVWLAPIGGERFRVGATYDRADLDPVPTPCGREEICARLREFLRLPFEVIDHTAGVRPIVEGGKPVLGVHPKHPQLAYLNGLGSKGALFAPFFAAQLVDYLVHGRPIDPDVSLNRGKSPAPSPRVVEAARAEVRAVLGAGEIAADATAGNGRDTAFLAELVGPTGHVFALDVQPLALHHTAALLQEKGYANVTLVQQDYARMGTILPRVYHGRVGAVMFNLGCLPGGDKSVAASPGSTPAAIRAGLALLRSGGVLTVVSYPGHPAGTAESDSVRGLVGSLPAAEFTVREVISDRPTAPRLFVIRKHEAE